MQDEVYLITQTDNNFTGQIIIEVEDDNPEFADEDAQDAGFDNEADRFIENFSNQSEDPLAVLFMKRPYGSKEMKVEQIKPNTNEKWYETNYQMSRAKIIELNQWSAKLLDDSTATGLNSGEAFLNVLKKMLPVIRSHQNNIDSTPNIALEAIIEYFNKPQFAELRLKSQSPYKEILNETEEDDNTTNSDGDD